MRIMYLLFSFTVGGTERMVASICNQMVYNKQEVYLFIVNNLIDERLIDGLNKNVHVKLLGRKVGSRDKISPLIEISKYIKENKIEVVHCNSFDAPELLLLSKFINPRCKVISTIHGIGQFRNINRLRIALRNLICDRFIGISDAVAQDMVNAGLDYGKVTRIYNGIDTDKYDCAAYKEYDENKVVIGCVARIEPELKGQDILLKAIREVKNSHPDIMVLFAGGVLQKQIHDYEMLLKYVKDNSLENNVKFLGNVDDIPGFLNKIDICVVPSRSEGFGLALVEALSMGVPCIASNIAGPKEIVENEGIGLLFNSDDVKSLYSSIEKVILNYSKFKEDAWKHRTQIKNNYSIKTMCDKLLEVYTSR